MSSAKKRASKYFCSTLKVREKLPLIDGMATTKISDLGSTFKQYFEIVPALSDALKDEVYRVRHQVYCEDLKFEPVRSDKRETDEYDPHSLHLLIRSVKTNEFIGCTRIVRPFPDDPSHPLPFEKACADIAESIYR